MLYKLGRFQEALSPLEKAAQLPLGQDATIWDHLGDCFERLNQPAKAAEAWTKALELGKAESRTDQKLIERIEQKLKNAKESQGQLRPERTDSP